MGVNLAEVQIVTLLLITWIWVRKIVCTVGMVITPVKGVLVAIAFFFPKPHELSA